jgi:hypothetical protein
MDAKEFLGWHRPRGQARFAPGGPLNVLWYGHQANFRTLVPGLGALGAAGLAPIKLCQYGLHLLLNRQSTTCAREGIEYDENAWRR